MRYALLSAGAVLMMFPFIWMILTSLKALPESIAMPPVWVPASPQWGNYSEAFTVAPFALYFRNSIIVSVSATALTLFVTVLAAYAFTIFDFPGKRLIFSLCLLTMMVPGEILIIQNFITVTKLKWIDTFQGIVVPSVASGFYVFMMQEYFMQTPKALYKAAKVDGCRDWKYLWKVMIPINKNAIFTIGILTMISHWNAFMWPLMVTNSNEHRVLSIGLLYFKDAVSSKVNLQMAGSTIVILPMVIFYLIFRRQIIAGVSRSGIKG